MTSVIGIKTEEGCIVCCDSRTIENDFLIGQNHPSQKKAWKVGSIIIAAAGPYVGMNLLQENPQLFEKELTTKSLVNEIVPSIFELFERRNQLIVDSEGYPRISNSIIVATPKNMWVIGTTGEVSETDFAAIGAFVEATAAHAALKLTGYHSKDAALLTVAAVSNTDNTVGYPLYILKTNSDITETYWSESAVVKSIEVRSWKN